MRAPVVHGRDPFAHDAVQLVDEEERLGLHVDAPAVHIWAFVAGSAASRPSLMVLKKRSTGALSHAFNYTRS